MSCQGTEGCCGIVSTYKSRKRSQVDLLACPHERNNHPVNLPDKLLLVDFINYTSILVSEVLKGCVNVNMVDLFAFWVSLLHDSRSRFDFGVPSRTKRRVNEREIYSETEGSRESRW